MARAKTPKILDDSAKVDAYMQALEHPLKAEMEAVRAIILGAHPGVTEGECPHFGREARIPSGDGAA